MLTGHFRPMVDQLWMFRRVAEVLSLRYDAIALLGGGWMGQQAA